MMKRFLEFIEEDAVPANATGGGNVAGLGGPNGEPGVDKRKKKTPVLGKIERRKPPQ